ncbi:UreD urease accessory protein-domain-containing protein [Syncephalastrum racemosum]|uniref:UreD urease accessory protein-domain-containing protein n=1 Tax=Syncephalastrum racemosum TaxID=13706 RepID=A0A1X2HFY3_SYNRA|nr:UreD urease accessory protein-domain-containing protein [Syncephalastrum racemosum]
MTLSVISCVPNEPGSGTLVCQCHGKTGKFSRIHAQYPLKFIPTKGHAERLSVVYMLSYGGGIVSGDQFNINITVESRAILLLLTQGNTKVFKDRVDQRMWLTSRRTAPASTAEDTASSVQNITADVVGDPGTCLFILPDPVTSFRNSSFASKQSLRLASADSELVLLDWFTSGRLSRGESWLFKHYSSRIDVYQAGKLVLRDHMVLDQKRAQQLEPYNCFATLIIVTKPDSVLYQSIQAVQAKAESERIFPQEQPRSSLLWSSSPFLEGNGLLVRVAGLTTEMVRDFVKLDCLGKGLEQIIGSGMFSKVLM